MSDLLDLIINTSPADNDVAVPLKTVVTVTLNGLDYNEDSLKEGLFVEGPDTDQFVGPGLIFEVTDPHDHSHPHSQDDFLQSPGYYGIVEGEVTVSGIDGDTVVSFATEIPLFPLTDYRINLTDVLDSSEEAIDGFVSFNFQTGSGSIEEIPSTVSTSVLATNAIETFEPGVLTVDGTPLEITSTTPTDDTVQVTTDLQEIEVKFNQDIDPATVSAETIIVRATAATDHPNVTVNTVEELAKTVTVDKNKLKITI